MSPQQGLGRIGKARSLRWTRPNTRKGFLLGERRDWMDKLQEEGLQQLYEIAMDKLAEDIQKV